MGHGGWMGVVLFGSQNRVELCLPGRCRGGYAHA